MSASSGRFVDPHHCPIVHADGPISVSVVQGTTVLSFSQLSPRLDDRQLSGIIGTDLEMMMVVARVGIPTVKIKEMINVLQKIRAASSAGGHA